MVWPTLGSRTAKEQEQELSSRQMLKAFSGEKIPSPVEMGPKNGGLGGNGVQTLDIGFATPKRHFFARNRVI